MHADADMLRAWRWPVAHVLAFQGCWQPCGGMHTTVLTLQETAHVISASMMMITLQCNIHLSALLTTRWSGWLMHKV